MDSGYFSLFLSMLVGAVVWMIICFKPIVERFFLGVENDSSFGRIMIKIYNRFYKKDKK
jgi:hypothetical protein